MGKAPSINELGPGDFFRRNDGVFESGKKAGLEFAGKKESHSIRQASGEGQRLGLLFEQRLWSHFVLQAEPQREIDVRHLQAGSIADSQSPIWPWFDIVEIIGRQ